VIYWDCMSKSEIELQKEVLNIQSLIGRRDTDILATIAVLTIGILFAIAVHSTNDSSVLFLASLGIIFMGGIILVSSFRVSKGIKEKINALGNKVKDTNNKNKSESNLKVFLIAVIGGVVSGLILTYAVLPLLAPHSSVSIVFTQIHLNSSYTEVYIHILNNGIAPLGFLHFRVIVKGGVGAQENCTANAQMNVFLPANKNQTKENMFSDGAVSSLVPQESASCKFVFRSFSKNANISISNITYDTNNYGCTLTNLIESINVSDKSPISFSNNTSMCN